MADTKKRSHPSRGAWIEIRGIWHSVSSRCCRTPRGVRGLKFCYIVSPGYAGESHPSRGAWIEIFSMASRSAPAYCRTPRGVRGLKSPPLIGADIPSRRTPRGVRGLKLPTCHHRCVGQSRTPRGVRGLKYQSENRKGDAGQSHPSRGAWIEMMSTTPS